MRGMYLHAERLLAKAGRQGAMGSGYRPPAAKRRATGGSDFRNENYGETPCAAPGQRPQRGLVSLFVRVSAHDLSGLALRAGHEAVTKLTDTEFSDGESVLGEGAHDKALVAAYGLATARRDHRLLIFSRWLEHKGTFLRG